MISLEWLRTFKAVYKNKNYSRAAEELYLSQPAVSNQISMLEAAIGHKLFSRKSKGVVPTENAFFLNNLIIEALDVLESVEVRYSNKVKEEDKPYVIGISSHLYKSLISDKILTHFKHLTIQFEESNKVLFNLVNEQQIDAAIVRDNIQTFDILSHHVLSSPLVAVGHPNIDTVELKNYIEDNNLKQIQQWMESQIWFSHISTNPYIKLFWLHCFNKSRPKIFTNYIIPNEYLMLQKLTEIEGVCISLLENAKEFIDKKSLKIIWHPTTYPTRDYYLIAHKKQESFFKMMQTLFVTS